MLVHPSAAVSERMLDGEVRVDGGKCHWWFEVRALITCKSPPHQLIDQAAGIL
jgi:hypothetical protein